MKHVSENIKEIIHMDQDLGVLIESFNNVLSDVLDKHAPLETKEITETEDSHGKQKEGD